MRIRASIAPDLLQGEGCGIAAPSPRDPEPANDEPRSDPLDDPGSGGEKPEGPLVQETDLEPARGASARVEAAFTGPQQDQLNGLVASLEERIRAVLSKPMPVASQWDEIVAEPPPVTTSLTVETGAVDPHVEDSAPEHPYRPAVESSTSLAEPVAARLPAPDVWRDFGWRSRPEALAPAELEADAQPDVAAEAAPPDPSVEEHSPDGDPERSQRTGDRPLSGSRAGGSPMPASGEAAGAFPDAQREAHESPVALTPEPILLTIGPVPGVRWLSALEQRLATAPGVERAALVSYRAGLAAFRLTVAEWVQTADVLNTVSDAAGPLLRRDVRGSEIRVWLRAPSAGVQA